MHLCVLFLVVGVMQDVTEAFKHNRAVAAMANKLRQLVETANAPIFGIDVHGNVNEWNNKTAEITGFSKDEAMGKHLVSTFIAPQLRNSVDNILSLQFLNKPPKVSIYCLFYHQQLH